MQCYFFFEKSWKFKDSFESQQCINNYTFKNYKFFRGIQGVKKFFWRFQNFDNFTVNTGNVQKFSIFQNFSTFLGTFKAFGTFLKRGEKKFFFWYNVNRKLGKLWSHLKINSGMADVSMVHDIKRSLKYILKILES